MPSRREGLLSLLMASPMAMLGCSTEEPNVETEGSSTGTTGSDTSSTGPVDPGTTSTGGTSTGDTGSSSGSSGLDGTTSTGPGPDDTTGSTGTTGESSSSSDDGEEESTTTGGQTGNTCDRVGDLFDMCFGGGYYYNYYEYACNYNISYFIGAGDLPCAQAYNDLYSCIADLECAELGMGAYQACDAENDVVNSMCNFGWETDSFGSFSESGVGFIVPETSGWATSGGFGGTDTDFGGWTDSGGGFGST